MINASMIGIFIVVVTLGAMKVFYTFRNNLKFVKEVHADPNHWARRKPETKLQRYIPYSIDEEGIIEMMALDKRIQI